MISGILFGLGAALCQSLSYIASGAFVRRFHRSNVVLLALSHAVMGVFAAVILCFVWPENMPPVSEYMGTLVWAVSAYLAGQSGLFMALRHTDASRVAPLLGMKLVLLALISVLFLGHDYGVTKWVAVAIAVGAAALLNESGGRIPLDSFLWVLFACVGYSFSDLNIKALVGHFSYLGLVRGCLVSASMAYVVCGLVGLIAIAFLQKPTRPMWRYAVPFAVAWFSAMLCLFACFGNVGVVFGNIVQSSRGLISIAIGAAISRAGWVHLERHISRDVLLRRILAGALMVAAIALFSV